MEETGQASSTAPAPVAGGMARAIKWLGNFVLGGSLLFVVIVVGAATLARYDLIPKIAGFIPFYLSLNPARALLLIGLAGLGMAWWRKTGGTGKLALGSVLSGGLLAAIYALLIIPAGKVPEGPPLHDITTDVDDPPTFRTLTLREDNLVPFASVEEWRAAHRQVYPDIAPILMESSPSETLAQARALVEQRGWELVSSDPESGYLEATATAGYVRFYDDVIIEVTPVADGSTRVDMRSVSRVGVGDVGYNAARIEAFLAELQAR